MFSLMLKGLSQQQIAKETLMRSLWKESVPDYVDMRTINDHMEKVRGQKYLSDSAVLSAEINLDILDQMEENCAQAIGLLHHEDSHLLQVQNKLMEKFLQNNP